MSEAAARALLLEAVVAGREQAARLLTLLEAEFEVLRGQDLQGFESLQAPKEALIAALARLVERVAQVDGTPHSPADSPDWSALRETMLRCREAHRRNDILVRKKLESIQAALRILQSGDASASNDIYDRLGRLSGRPRGRGYTEA